MTIKLQKYYRDFIGVSIGIMEKKMETTILFCFCLILAGLTNTKVHPARSFVVVGLEQH